MSVTETRDYRAVFERRMVSVVMTPGVLMDMCKVGHRLDAECIEGLPADAKLWEASYSVQRNVFLLDCYSPTFDRVPEGQEYPEINVVFRTVTA